MLPSCGTSEEAADLLRRFGIAVTLQRVEIALAIFARRRHMSADEILAAVHERQSAVSKATVYNTLKLFCERGLVSEVIVDPSRVYYDPETVPHHHFYEVDTGTLTDIPADGVRIDGLPELPHGMEAERVDIVVRTRRSADVA